MAYEAGTAILEVVPSFLNIESMLAKGARNMAQGLDKALGPQLGKAMQNAAKDAERETGRAGAALGKTMADNAMRKVRSALASIPKDDNILRSLRAELEAISKIDVSKGFDERAFIHRVERVQAALKKAQQDANGVNAVGRYTNAGNAAAELGAVTQIVEAARKRGYAAGDAYSNAYLARLKAMENATPDLQVRQGSSPDERRAAVLRQRIQDAQKGRVGDVVTSDNNPLNLKIGVKVSAADLKREMETIEGLLDQFVEQVGQIELAFDFDRARQQAAGFFEDTKTDAQRAAEVQAQAFLKALEDAYQEQDRRDRKRRADLVKAHEDAIAEDYKREKKARDDLGRVHDEAIKEQYKRDLKARQDFARAYDDAVKEQYKRDLKARQDFDRAYDDAVQENYRRQRQALQDFADQHEAALKENQRRAEEALRGTAAGDFQGKARGAAGAIQRIPVHLQTDAIDREMEAIRVRLARLGERTVGVNIDAVEFGDKVEAEFDRLKQIAKNTDFTINVRTDAAKAATELGAILAMMSRIKADKATVKVDTDGAVGGLTKLLGSLDLNLGRLGAMIAVGSSIGTAIIPAAAAAASAIAAIGTAALAAGSGLGVALLGFAGIGEAVQAMDQAARDQQKSNVALSRSNSQVESALDQVQSAEMALANTRRTNRVAAIKAQRAIRDAIDDQRDALRQAGREQQDAVLRIADSQRDLARAEENSRRTRAALNEAYRDARRALDDLNSSVRGNALNQRQATLDIAKAKQELEKAKTNPRADAAEREQAEITYQQRLLQMDDLKRKGGELEDEQEKRFREGIAKSEQVVRARQNIVDAEDRLLSAQRDAARAQRSFDDARREGQERIKDAQQRTADAQAAAAEQQRQAAYSQFTGTQSLEAAQRALKNAYDRTGVAGGAALDKLNQAMQELSPTQQRFAEYLFGLKPALKALRGAADPVVAGLQKAMVSLFGATSDEATKRLQPVLAFIGKVATALGGMFERLAETLKGPTFTRFFTYLSDTAVPTLTNMYTAFENILLGVTNLFLAFTPLSGTVEGGFVAMTERFREWSESLDTNKGFQHFLAYLRDSGPQVAALIGGMVTSISKLVVAAAPVGTVVVGLFTQLFEMINKVPEKTLTALVAGIAAAASALALFAGATALVGLSTAGAVAGGIALLVVAFSALVGSSDGLRAALSTAWEAIKTGAMAAFAVVKDAVLEAWNAVQPTLAQLGEMFKWLWKEVIVPAAQGIWTVLQQLYETVKPVFELIAALIKPIATAVWWLLKYVIIPVVAAIVYALVKVLTPVIKFLWKWIIKPILESIGLAFRIAAAIIKVAVGLILIVLKALGMLFNDLWKNYIKPFWEEKVRPLFKSMGTWFRDHVAKPWQEDFKRLGKIWDSFVRLLTTPVKFIVETVLNDGLLAGYNWLADWFDIEPKNVKIPAPKGGWNALYATGGAVYGPGTGTSDSIPARLSAGEHVLTAEEVRRAGGHSAIYALRKLLLQGFTPPGFARGGAVEEGKSSKLGLGGWLRKIGKSVTGLTGLAFKGAQEFLRDPAGSLKTLAEALYAKIPMKDSRIVQKILAVPTKIVGALTDKVSGLFGDNTGGEPLGAGTGAGGWAWQEAVLKAAFGDRVTFTSTTGGGHAKNSWHYRGRALDSIGPDMLEIYRWIRSHYGSTSKELIYSPAGSGIKDGRPVDIRSFYGDSVYKNHWSHVHWAYDKGGELPDTRRMPGGVMQVFHGRRTPDKVLTDQQWTNVSVLANKARQTMGGGDTYNFPYRDSTLNKQELDNFFARRDALNRVGRANF